MVAEFREQLARQSEIITRLREMIATFKTCLLALLADPTDPLALLQAEYLIAKADKLEQELTAHYPQLERR
jgi:hypothetical protein